MHIDCFFAFIYMKKKAPLMKFYIHHNKNVLKFQTCDSRSTRRRTRARSASAATSAPTLRSLSGTSNLTCSFTPTKNRIRSDHFYFTRPLHYRMSF